MPELQYKSEGEWTECFEVKSVTLPNVLYLGFTAITGEVSDNHDIINVLTRNIFSTNTHADPARPSKSHTKSKGSSWLWTFIKIILFFGVLAGAFYGFKQYKRNQKKDYMGF